MLVKRLFSKSILNSSQYIKKPDIDTEKVSQGPKEQSEKMKKVFGEEYKTPFEKYDLFVPRTEIGDNKTMYERYHEKNQYKDSKKLLGFLAGVSLCITGYIYKDNYRNKKIGEEYIENALKRFRARKENTEIAEKVYYEKRKKSKEELAKINSE